MRNLGLTVFTSAALALGSWSELVAQTGPFDAWACASAIQFDGPHEDAHIGFGLASNGDWNGDGKDDLLVSSGGMVGVGDAWLHYGQNLQNAIHFIFDDFPNDDFRLGPSVAFVGDINGCGEEDIAIGNPYWTDDPLMPNKGRVLVFFGENRGTLPNTVVLDGNACDADVIIEYRGDLPMLFGWSLAGANFANTALDPGDLESPPDPQYSDLLVGAPGHPDWFLAQNLCNPLLDPDPPCVPIPDGEGKTQYLMGEVNVFLGARHEPLDPSNPSAALAGYGSWTLPCGFSQTTGQCTSDGPLVFDAEASRFRVLRGALDYRDRFGFSLARLGDVYDPLTGSSPGDGFDEVIIGAPQGRMKEMGRTAQVDPFYDEITGVKETGYAQVWSLEHNAVATLDSSITPPPSSCESPVTCYEVSLFGWSVAAAGKLDGDFIPDVLVGAPGFGERPDSALPGEPCCVDIAESEALLNGGGVFMFSGDCSGPTPLARINPGLPVSLLSFESVEECDPFSRGDLFAYSLAGGNALDVDLDARPEFVVGLPGACNMTTTACGACPSLPGGGTKSGRVYLIEHDPGQPEPLNMFAVFRGEFSRDGLGMAVSTGFFDDAIGVLGDLIFSGPRLGLSCTANEEGRVYLFRGEDVQFN